LYNATTDAQIRALGQKGGRIGQIINGDKRSKRCDGLLAFERDRQQAEPDRTALAVDVALFWAWYTQKHPDLELRDCVKFIEHWVTWRASNPNTPAVKRADPNCPICEGFGYVACVQLPDMTVRRWNRETDAGKPGVNRVDVKCKCMR
jgi:hypothetical protein